jgi:hypothetical protein
MLAIAPISSTGLRISCAIGWKLARPTDQTKVEIDRTDIVKLIAEPLQIPARSRRQLIVGQPIGALFFLALAARKHYRYRPQLQPVRRSDP